MFLAELVGVSLTMTGVYLVTSVDPRQRLIAFILLTIAGCISIPLMWSKGLNLYASVQLFYISMNLLGIYRLYQSPPES